MEEQKVCDLCAGEHLGSCTLASALTTLSTNLRDSLQGTSRWNVSDTTAGLFKVFHLHAFNGAIDTITHGIEVNDSNELAEMLEWMRWSHAAYENDKEAIATKLDLNVKDLVKMTANAGINKPAFFIGIHHNRRCVVISIRGTYQKQDMFTDVNPNIENFLEGSAHSGMLRAARWLFENEGHILQSLLTEHLGYKLVVTGHSLGAATGGLLAMIIHATDGWFIPKEKSGVNTSKILCWGYGCAPCVDRKLAESSNFIHNIVLQDDIVPRITPAAVEALRNEILATSWSEVVQDETTKKLLDALGHVHSNFGTLFATGGSLISTVGSQAGAALFQKFGNLHTASASSSTSSILVEKSLEKIDISTRNYDAEASGTAIVATTVLNTGTVSLDIEEPRITSVDVQLSTNIPKMKENAEESDIKIAAPVVMTVATRTSMTMEELERRRLFVPGILYHIKRLKHKHGKMSLPTSPTGMSEAGEEALKNLQSKYVVVRGMEPKERLGRVILSKTMISDHTCPRYIRAISLALSSCLNV